MFLCYFVMAMYIDIVPNRQSPPAVLLRESYREYGKVKKRTLANLSKLPRDIIEQLRLLLQGGQAVADFDAALEVVRSLPHGHVAAVLGTVFKTGLDQIISSEKSRELSLILAMIIARVLDPKSKLATARGLDPETACSSLGEVLGLGRVIENDLYFAMDWLGEQQERIENTLAAKHLKGGLLLLYDITSTYFEGRTCPLAKFGYNRDGKKGKLQIVVGLLCAPDGCPVAVEVFEGNLADAATLPSQLTKIRERFGIERVVLVGDRGIITQARIRQDLRDKEGLGWITALRAPQIRQLLVSERFQLTLFDTQDMAEITHPDYPDERLIVCRNPALAQERARKREELLLATEEKLDEIVRATSRAKRRLKGKDKIALRVGKVIRKFKVAKHFELSITDESFTYHRKDASIAQETALDGIYVIRTSLPREILDTNAAVGAYKSLSQVEAAFRSLKSIDLKIRPIFHRLAERVKAHVFLCMLAYYVEWHMRKALAPILFDDHDPDAAAKSRPNMVAPAERSEAAKRKARTKMTDDNLPVHSFRTLLLDLGTITKNTMKVKRPGNEPAVFQKLACPTPLQQRAFELLGVKLGV
jgi:hypothetical protein